jgi:hypothetical protein
MGRQPVKGVIEELVWVQLSKWTGTRVCRVARDLHLHITYIMSGHVVGVSPVPC